MILINQLASTTFASEFQRILASEIERFFSRKIKRAENVVCFVFALDSAFEFRAKYLNQVLNLPIDIDYISIL